MRTAGGVLGIIGSIAGFFVAGLGFLIGVLGVAASKAANDAYNQVQADPTAVAAAGGKEQIAQGAKAAADVGTWASWAAAGSGILAILCVAGLIGGIMAFFKPSIGALLMVIAGVGGVIIANVFWSFSAFFLIIGAVLAFLGSMQKQAPQAQLQPAGTPGYYPPQQAYPQPYQQQGYYPQQQPYPQQQNYYPQQQPGFPPAPQYGQPNAQPQQPYYPQPQQSFPPSAQGGGQQQFYPQPSTAQEGPRVVPPRDSTNLN